MIFIDWATADLPYNWEVSIDGGKFIELDRKDNEAKRTAKRLIVKSKWGTSLAIRTHISRMDQKLLEVSGNPTKFYQGHNAFGGGDLMPLMNQTIDVLCAGNLPSLPNLSPEELEIWQEIEEHEGKEDRSNSFYQVKPSDKERDGWNHGYYRLKRLDLTAMVELSSRAEVRAVIHALKNTATVHRRGAGSWYDGTLYFGLTNKGSKTTPWMLIIYCKADEMKLNEVPRNIDDFDNPKAAREWGGSLPDKLPHRDEICAWVDNKIRVELRLNSAELTKLGLQWGHCWTPLIVREVFKSYLSRMNIGGIVCDAVEETSTLSLSLRRTFSEWKRGIDVRQYMNRQTFSRHRKEILDITGCDISGSPLTEAPRLDLQKILVNEISPAPLPAWALGVADDIPF